MDNRIEDIFRSLLANIETLDSTLHSMCRSELIVNNDECQCLIDDIREACISTLHGVLSVERKLQGNAFVIPEDVSAAIE